MNSSESPYYKGQTVTLHSFYNRTNDIRVPVTRVARKYAYVTVYGREEAYDAVTGVSKDSRSCIYTDGQLARVNELAAKQKLLDKLGFHKFQLKISAEHYYELYDFLKERGYADGNDG